jgi:hypothetical protein
VLFSGILPNAIQQLFTDFLGNGGVDGNKLNEVFFFDAKD